MPGGHAGRAGHRLQDQRRRDAGSAQAQVLHLSPTPSCAKRLGCHLPSLGLCLLLGKTQGVVGKPKGALLAERQAQCLVPAGPQ